MGIAQRTELFFFVACYLKWMSESRIKIKRNMKNSFKMYIARQKKKKKKKKNNIPNLKTTKTKQNK